MNQQHTYTVLMTKFKTVPAYYLEIGYNLLTNYEFTYALCSIQYLIISFIGRIRKKKKRKKNTHSIVHSGLQTN